MTDMPSPRRSTVPAALALSAGLLAGLIIPLSLAASAGATELTPPSAKSKLLSDRNVTIVIIDGDEENRSTSTTPPAKTLQPADLTPEKLRPSARIERDDADIKITIKRDTGSTTKPGPKIIIIDGTTNGCDGGTVCVIRP